MIFCVFPKTKAAPYPISHPVSDMSDVLGRVVCDLVKVANHTLIEGIRSLILDPGLQVSQLIGKVETVPCNQKVGKRRSKC